MTTDNGTGRKDFTELYKLIAKDDWFKKAYEGKSFGEIEPQYVDQFKIKAKFKIDRSLPKIYLD